MHKYLMEIRHFFRGNEQFVIEAENKADALVKAKEHVDTDPHFFGGNYDKDIIKCVKKMKG